MKIPYFVRLIDFNSFSNAVFLQGSLFFIPNAEFSSFKYGLTTNDYLLGVSFTSMMNSLAISYGLMAIKYDKVVAEALIHPCRYEDDTIDNHFEEFQITKNQKLKEKIEKLGFEITNYANNEQD